MRVMKLVLACLVVVALSAATALAQEGYPLKGSWLGDYGPNKTTRTQVFLVMDWDGKAISGMINPGTDNIPIKNATLTPPTPASSARRWRWCPRWWWRRWWRSGGWRGGGRWCGCRWCGSCGNPAAASAAAAPPPPAQTGPVQPDWLFHAEAEGKDRSGATVRYVIDGKVENIGLANRYIVGTWTVGTTKNDFRLVRQ